MPSTISRKCVLFEKTGQAPSPSKDFHQLLVTEEELIWRTWRVSLRKDQVGIPPSQNKQSHEDFYYDNLISADIKRVFGEDILIYVQCIVCNDWLYRMKDEILLKIFSYLDLSHITRLPLVCRHFRAICNKNQLWKNVYETHCSNITDEIEQLGEDIGWKKLFFTNKLQIQKETSRRRRSANKNDEKIAIQKSLILAES